MASTGSLNCWEGRYRDAYCDKRHATTAYHIWLPDSCLAGDGLVATARLFDYSALPVQAFEKHKVEKFSGLGDKFDPNLHQALFELPNPAQEPGTVGVVTKVGAVPSTMACLPFHVAMYAVLCGSFL